MGPTVTREAGILADEASTSRTERRSPEVTLVNFSIALLSVDILSKFLITLFYFHNMMISMHTIQIRYANTRVLCHVVPIAYRYCTAARKH